MLHIGSVTQVTLREAQYHNYCRILIKINKNIVKIGTPIRMVRIFFRRLPLCLILIGSAVATGLIIMLYSFHLSKSNIYLELTKLAETDCKVPLKYKKLPPKFNVPPTGDKNIFFVETWRGCNTMAHLTARTACSIESAALINSKWMVYVFFIDVMGYDHTISHLFNKLNVLPNVQIRSISLDELSKDTNLHNWVQAKHYEKSKYLVSHVSDLCRVLVMYKYAGTYMDTDIISLKPLESLRSNYAVAEGYFQVVPGFMNFGSDDIGRSTIKKIIDRFEFYWNPDQWSAQGPDLMTGVMRKICSTIFTSKMTEDRCGGFRAIPVTEVLAIDFQSRHYFFDSNYFKTGLKAIENSTATHLWNAFTGATNISKSTTNLFNYLALQHCPSVFLDKELYW